MQNAAMLKAPVQAAPSARLVPWRPELVAVRTAAPVEPHSARLADLDERLSPGLEPLSF